MQLSSNALNGLTSHQVMRLKGTHDKRTLYILVDSGSTYNFLTKDITLKIECKLKLIKGTTVKVANREKLNYNSMCEEFCWKVHGHQFSIDAYILPLNTYDLILGIQWLLTLGDILWNFKELKMTIIVKRQPFILKGLEEPRVTAVSNLQLQKIQQKT